MLKTSIILFAFSMIVFSFPASEDPTKPPQVEIVSSDSEVLPNGTFHFSYEGSDGSKASQEGTLKVVDEKNAGETIKGSYEYVGDDGKTYSVTYYADETGFHAEGEHIPKIPEAIARSIEWAKEHPYTEEPVNTTVK